MKIRPFTSRLKLDVFSCYTELKAARRLSKSWVNCVTSFVKNVTHSHVVERS